MDTIIKVKRAEEDVINTTVFDPFEIGFTTDTKKLVLFDGMEKQKYLPEAGLAEAVQDSIGGMVENGEYDGISVLYDDENNKLNFSVDDVDGGNVGDGGPATHTIPPAYIDADASLAANSNARVPTQKAVRSYLTAYTNVTIQNSIEDVIAELFGDGGGYGVSVLIDEINDKINVSVVNVDGGGLSDTSYFGPLVPPVYLDSDIALTSNANDMVPTQRAVRMYIDHHADAVLNSAISANIVERVASDLNTTYGNSISALSEDYHYHVGMLSGLMEAVDISDLNSMKSYVSAMSGSLQSNITSLRTDAYNFSLNLSDRITTVSTNLRSRANSQLDSLASHVHSDINTLSGFVSNQDVSLINSLKSNISAMSGSLQSNLTSLESHIHDDIALLSGDLHSDLNTLSANLSNADSAILNSAKSNISAMSGSLGSVDTANLNSAKSNISAMSGSLQSQISDHLNSAKSNISAMSGSLQSMMSAMSGSLQSQTSAMSGSLQSNITSAISNISAMSGSLQSMISAMSGSLHSRILAMSGSLQSNIDSLDTHVHSDIATLSGFAVSADTTILNSAKSNISAMSGSLQSMISTMSGSLGFVDTTNLNSAKSCISAMSGSLQSNLNLLSGSLTEIAQDAVGALFGAGTFSGVSCTYDDTNNFLNMGLVAHGSGFHTGTIGTAAQIATGTFPTGAFVFSGTAYTNQAGNSTVSGTITLDLAANDNWYYTLNGNITLANPSNMVAGQTGIIVLVQDGSGSHTLTLGGYWKFPSGVSKTLSTSGNAVDAVTYYVASSTVILCNLMTGFA